MFKCHHDEQFAAFRASIGDHKVNVRKAKDLSHNVTIDTHHVTHNVMIIGRSSTDRNSEPVEVTFVHKRTVIERMHGRTTKRENVGLEASCKIRCSVKRIGSSDSHVYNFIPKLDKNLSGLIEIRVKQSEDCVKTRYVSELTGIAGVYDEWLHNR